MSHSRPFLAGFFGLLVCASVAAANLYPARSPVPESTAQQWLLDTLVTGGIATHWLVPSWRQLDESARVELVRTGIGWAREFSRSAAFLSAYAARREAARPAEPEEEPSADAQLQQQQQQMNEQLEAMREMAKQFSGEERAQMEAAIEESAQAMKAMSEDSTMLEYQRQGFEMQGQDNLARHQKDLQRWQQDWPERVEQLIARRLDEFSASCAAVDYNAELEPGNGRSKRRFLDPVLERKPWSWKLCYRAGKAPTEAALALAREWRQQI